MTLKEKSLKERVVAECLAYLVALVLQKKLVLPHQSSSVKSFISLPTFFSTAASTVYQKQQSVYLNVLIEITMALSLSPIILSLLRHHQK